MSVGLRERKLIFGEAATVALLEQDEERVLPELGSKNRLDLLWAQFLRVQAFDNLVLPAVWGICRGEALD